MAAPIRKPTAMVNFDNYLNKLIGVASKLALGICRFTVSGFGNDLGLAFEL